MLNNNNSLSVKRFLSTPDGVAFIEFLKEGMPQIEGTTFEATALSAKELGGYQKCLNRIRDATETVNEPTSQLSWVGDNEKDY